MRNKTEENVKNRGEASKIKLKQSFKEEKEGKEKKTR